jgi:DNA-directed RNA polymerase subunit beta'
MILGIYYLSQAPINTDKIEGYFVDSSEIEQSLECNAINVHSRIISRFETITKKEKL